MAVEEDMVKQGLATGAVRATAREEATTGGSSSSTTQQDPFLRPWRPERLPLSHVNADRPANFDPRGSYPKAGGKGATDRRASVERRLLKRPI